MVGVCGVVLFCAAVSLYRGKKSLAVHVKLTLPINYFASAFSKALQREFIQPVIHIVNNIEFVNLILLHNGYSSVLHRLRFEVCSKQYLTRKSILLGNWYLSVIHRVRFGACSKQLICWVTRIWLHHFHVHNTDKIKEAE